MYISSVQYVFKILQYLTDMLGGAHEIFEWESFISYFEQFMDALCLNNKYT